jgi:hypothetical protein
VISVIILMGAIALIISAGAFVYWIRDQRAYAQSAVGGAILVWVFFAVLLAVGYSAGNIWTGGCPGIPTRSAGGGC